jgi:SAM-dependent methyltransferase
MSDKATSAETKTVDWSEGYVTEIEYTHGYYPELNPLRVRLAMLGAGLACREVRSACELGYGQGLSINLHAAAGGVSWAGTDFNPVHAAGAQALAEASGSGARLFDDAFAEFVRRTDLPSFDFIALHGIWSWVSDANRDVIVEFLRRRLAVGGVVYISYNTQPGWAGFAPMRHLMVEHTRRVGPQGAGVVGRVDAAIGFAERVLATQPAFARAHPQVAERIQKLKEQPRRYLAHEYFNLDWHPMHFATLADWLAPAKLQYAGSAHLMDQIDGVNFTPEQRSLLRECADPVFREGLRDVMVNQQFRRDLWVRGSRRLSPTEQREALAAMRLVLVVPPRDVPRKLSTPLGPATLNARVLEQVLDIMGTHRVWSLGDLERQLAPRGVAYANLVEMVFLLVGTGSLHPAQDEAAIEAARPATQRLNARLIDGVRLSADAPWLASPVTGGGVPVGRIQGLFLGALRSVPAEADGLAESAWRSLEGLGERLLRDGKRLEDPAENLKELTRLASEFLEFRLPVLRALQIAPEA